MSRARLPDSAFWVEPEEVGPHRLRLSAEESHHLLHVHRAHEETPFEAIDGRGGFYRCVLESVERRVAVGRILERVENKGELSAPLELIAGLPDWRAVEQVVEHAVPLGATALDFAVCERSARGALGPERITRLLRIARAGIKQSRRSRLPLLRSSASLAEAVRILPEGLRLAADPDGNPFSPDLLKNSQGTVQIAVGPPGGFTEEERGLLEGAEFFRISLGPSRLTTETSALAFLSLARNSLRASKL